MIKYRYSLIDSYLKYGINLHPQTQMKNLGYEIIKSEPCTISDSWIFIVKNEIENTPTYLEKITDDFKFNT